MITLTPHPIDPQELLREAQTAESGAVLLFLGITRQFTAGRETTHLCYDAYREMAESELAKLEAAARERWNLNYCHIVHRLGLVPLAEASLAVVVASAHRQACFDAGSWLVDTLKERVPIWKQENWADGTSEWMHPTTDPARKDHES